MNDLAKLQQASAQERADALRHELRASAESVVRAAQILGIMEELGDDTSKIPPNVVRLLRRVRQQTMLPEVFLELSGRLRSRTASLPLQQQRDVLTGKPVPLVILSERGAEVLSIDPRKLQPAQVMQVFADGRLRDESEQRAWLEAERAAHAPPSGDDPHVELLPRKGGIRVNGVFLSRRELARFLEQLG